MRTALLSCVAALSCAIVIPASGEPSPDPTLSPAQWHADLLFLSTQLAKRHANAFHHISREAFQSEVNRLDAQLAKLGPDPIFARMDQIVNSIGDGHTPCEVFDDRGGNFIRSGEAAEDGKALQEAEQP